MDFILVTPVLDGWPRIRATVASVRAQTTADIPSDFRIRHVVQLSDRSTDPSGEWLRQQSGVEVRVESDTGLYDAIARGFQTGLASLDGEGQRETVLSWLNADEQLLPGALARVAEEFRRHPEADVVFGDYLLLDADGRPTAWRREIPAHGWLLRNGVNSVLSCATFFRRRVWDSLGGFDPAFSLVADKDFYLRALAAGFRFRHIRAPLAAYGNTGDNATLRHPLLALREQAHLRAKAGARGPAVRRFARVLRRLLKLVHGCYGRRTLRTTLFDSEGRPAPIQTRLGTRWEDPADGVARRRILPSLPRRLAFAALGMAAAMVRVFRPAARAGGEDRSRGLPPLLLLEPFGLGDAIALQPLVRALCEAGRTVRVATRRAWFPVFPPHPNLTLIEAVPPWAARDDRAKYRHLLARTRPFLAALRPYAAGAVGIDPRGDVRSVLALHLAGCVRVKTLTHYYTANDCRVMPGTAHVRHAIVRTVPRWQLNGVFALDLDLAPPDLRFLLEKPGSPKVPPSSSHVSRLMSQNRRETGSGKPETVRVALIPLSPWTGKRWNPAGWEAVVRGLRERGAEPVALCGPGEEDEARAALGGADVPVRVCGDIAAWARALDGASAAIAVNTGPMHLASALGIPVVLLEGSSRQPLWQPPRRPFAVVSHQAETPCAPCHQVGDCRRCGRRCMERITASEVLDAVERLGYADPMENIPARAPSPPRRRHRWLRRVAVGFALAALAVVIVSEAAVCIASAGRIESDPDALPHANAAVVLGCSRRARGGGENLYFRARVNAAARLYHARKVGMVVVSGDNRWRGYDEPTDMKNALVALGVPEDRIVCDYAGLRTLDTVVRAHDVFQQEDFILVSQRFHLRRALFLARCRGIPARGFAAGEVRLGRRLLLRQLARERLARIVALLDAVSGRKPRFLGPKETPPMRYVPSPNHSPRTRPVSLIVLHYTVTKTLEQAVRILTATNTPHPVSSHYVVGLDGEIVQLVPEDRRARHAGVSFWRGETDVNSASIGIEIVNMGPDADGVHPPFPEKQIAAVSGLCRDIQAHYAIRDVVAHSDVAPTRKQDPGAAFPWKRLAAEGVGVWTDRFVQSKDPDAKLLAEIGYDVTRPEAALLAFQRHYYPEAVLSGGKRTHERLAAVAELFRGRREEK